MTVLLDASALTMAVLQQMPGVIAVEELIGLAREAGEDVYIPHHAYLDARARLHGSTPLLDELRAWVRKNDLPLASLLPQDEPVVRTLIESAGMQIGAAHAALLAATLRAEIATFEPQAYVDVVHPALILYLDDPGDYPAARPV